jgi:benzoyl-CoA 2,3-dioxygenase component B
MSTINYSEKIPNNVNLGEDRTLQRALEGWQPNFLNWWDDVGPEGSTNHDVYLRTAVSVDPQGWAQFGHVKMRDYRWGIFLNPGDANREIHFGDHKGEKAWQDVPGEHRANLRRIIVTQGDTEPASVEQQRHLGLTAPSMYDLRNLFQINVEEGRHLWAMVYLLHKHFGRDGREEAEALLQRTRATRTTRASWVPSTRRRPTGWRSSCSPTSPTATASSSSRRWPRARSIRWPAPPSSC